MEDSTGVEEAIRDFLGMATRPVGVKLYRRGEPLPEGPFDEPEKDMTFCRFVREAAKGRNFLIKEETLDCANAEIVLGFLKPKYVKIEPRIEEETAALRVGAVAGSDVVMLILDPEQVMTMSILLDGVQASFKGNLAVCGEAMAQVYNTGRANLTFLCNGARIFGTYETSEIVLALPYRVFATLPSKIARFAALSRKAKDELAQVLAKMK